MPGPRLRARDDLPGLFRGRILAIDREAARHYAALRAALERRGRTLGDNDIWIAASAMAAGLTVVTHDADFRSLGARTLDPWR